MLTNYAYFAFIFTFFVSVLPIFAKVLIFVTKEIDENITKHYAIKYRMVLSLYSDYYTVE